MQPPGKRIILFVNGEPPQESLVRKVLAPGDLVFCADGGAEYAVRIGLQPHRVIGDLDSISAGTLETLQAAGVRIDRYPREKDETDLELALQQACLESPETILLIGAFGGRPDHMLANLLVLTQPRCRMIKIVLLKDDSQVTILHSGQDLTVCGNSGDILSLIPLTETVCGASLEGVKWELRGERLMLGGRRTISNELAASFAKLKIGSGILAVIYHGSGRGFI